MKTNLLTEREQQALAFAKQYYRWRQKFGETREQHNTKQNPYIKLDIWDSWYEFPTGDEWINENYAIVRRLLAEKRI